MRFSTFLSILVITHLFDYRNPSGCVVVSHCGYGARGQGLSFGGLLLKAVRGLPSCFPGDSNIHSCRWSFLLRCSSFSVGFFNFFLGIMSLVPWLGKGICGLTIQDTNFFSTMYFKLLLHSHAILYLCPSNLESLVLFNFSWDYAFCFLWRSVYLLLT